MTNIILATDSYKLGHWNQYPKDTEGVYSYFESRIGARFPYTVFFGLQAILKRYLVGNVISWDDLSEANRVSGSHFAKNLFNYPGWSYIMEQHGGKLPLRIKAVPEGTPVPISNVLMTVENTDPKCFWLTNAVESLLTHVWYPSTVATLSRTTKELIGRSLSETAESDAGLQFMLHDFGYRGASSHETAAIGGMAHLVNFVGTDTLPGMLAAIEYYGAELDSLAFSVPATEHSVMTALGEEGEFEIVSQLLSEHPEGILSVVADSYDTYRFVNTVGTRFKQQILDRGGVFVIRPDSVTAVHDTPGKLVVWIMERLWRNFGGHTNSKGYRVLDPHVRVLWGDGIDPDGIASILAALALHSFSTENMATFGMGGGLLQKVDRDTQRFAFKASAINRGGEWHDVFKTTLNKESKKGRLQLSRFTGEYGDFTYETFPEGTHVGYTLDYRGEHDQRSAVPDLLETVFEDGELVKEYTFDQVRENAKIEVPTLV